MEGKNRFLLELDRVFKSITGKDLRSMERIMTETATINYAGEHSMNSMRYKPFYFLKYLCYFATKGSGKYEIDRIIADVSLFDEKRGEKILTHFELKEFLHWANRHEVFEVKWGPAQAPTSVESLTVEVDVSPLFWKWGFTSEEVK